MNDDSRLSGRNNNFDLLRLFGALCVLISHCFGIRGLAGQEPLYRISLGRYMFSDIGLAIFFTISGFLICKSLLESPTVKSFWLKRVLRIWPALLVNVLITVFFIGIWFTSLTVSDYLVHPLTLKYLLVNISLAQTWRTLPGVFNGEHVNNSLWTISFEVKLYFLLWLAYLTGMFKKRVLLVLIWLLYILFLIGLYNHWFPPVNQALSDKMYGLKWPPYFLGGSVLYLYRNRINLKAGICVLLLGLCLLVFKFLPLYTDISLCVFLMYATLYFSCGIPKLFVIKSDISYGSYLYAYPVALSIQALTGSRLTFPVYLCLVILVTGIFGLASWFGVERKALALKSRVSLTAAG
jgi:peptidoglycan/LPS O-acetylase OafA/YrhL